MNNYIKNYLQLFVHGFAQKREKTRYKNKLQNICGTQFEYSRYYEMESLSKRIAVGRHGEICVSRQFTFSCC